MGGTPSKPRTNKGLQRRYFFGSGRNCSTFAAGSLSSKPLQTRAALRSALFLPQIFNLLRLGQNLGVCHE